MICFILLDCIWNPVRGNYLRTDCHLKGPYRCLVRIYLMTVKTWRGWKDETRSLTLGEALQPDKTLLITIFMVSWQSHFWGGSLVHFCFSLITILTIHFPGKNLLKLLLTHKLWEHLVVRGWRYGSITVHEWTFDIFYLTSKFIKKTHVIVIWAFHTSKSAVHPPSFLPQDLKCRFLQCRQCYLQFPLKGSWPLVGYDSVIILTSCQKVSQTNHKVL